MKYELFCKYCGDKLGESESDSRPVAPRTVCDRGHVNGGVFLADGEEAEGEDYVWPVSPVVVPYDIPRRGIVQRLKGFFK